MTVLIDAKLCAGCAACIDACPNDAITLNEDIVAVMNEDKCLDCGACIDECPARAMEMA
ncbi:MAG TPA: 4Fe-4S dicluster domain-containing protein [Candidatus Hydrogenedentes bacterium]|nr:4Fe-4S dicluster domain-containing protein [Candidatus Hydrogenedentota bacterium]